MNQSRLVVPPSAGQVATSPELRTFLFADIRGYTRFTQEQGDRAAGSLVARFAGVLREVIAPHAGRLIELRGDEALVVFSSARQALVAAVEAQNRFRRETDMDPLLPLHVGIGLDAGEAVPVEGGYRGDALNLAARLCNLAGPGEVLASEGVVYLGRRVQGLSYAERGLVPLKGFAQPVHVIRVLGEGEQLLAGEIPSASGPDAVVDRVLPIGGFLGALPSGVLVGREREWESIMAAMERTMQSSGRLVMLSGEPGIGKTRLAQEVTLKGRHWGYLVAAGRCYLHEQAVPYYPFVEILTTLVADASASVRATIPLRWPQLARLLPEDLGLAPTTITTGSDDQQRLFRAVTSLVETISVSRPVAILLDDLHWADEASLRLLQHLARHTRAQRVFLLGTYRDVELGRDHPLQSLLLEMGRESLVEDIPVRPLGAGATRELVREMLGAATDIDDLAYLIHNRTEGNVFFVQEMVRGLIEQGDLYRQDGHWEPRAIEAMDVPRSIRSVIGQRLARLSGEAQTVLQYASVFGQEFAFDEVLQLVQSAGTGTPQSGTLSEDEIDAALTEASAAGLIRQADRDGYAFEHALIQQALYLELSTRRRTRLHRIAGNTLEGLSEADRISRAPELAWHFLEGDDAERALPYAVLAGDQAENVYAHGDAERHYRTALELARDVDDAPSEAEALEKLAGVLAIMARYDDALDVLEQAASVHAAVGNVELEACCLAEIGHLHVARGTHQQGIERLGPLVRSIENGVGDGPSYGIAALVASFASLHVGMDQIAERLSLSDRAADMARALGDTRLLLSIEVTRADALWRAGLEDEALRVLEGVIPRAEAGHDLNSLTRALANAARYYARRGELHKNRSYQERMLRVAERRGDRGQTVLAAVALSTNAFLMGEWRRSMTYLEQAEHIIQTLGSWSLSLWPSGARAWLVLRQGDIERAWDLAERTIEAAESVGDSDYEQLGHRALAEVEQLREQPEAALVRLTPWINRAEAVADVGLFRQLAQAYLALDEHAEALAFAERAIALATEEKDQPELVDSMLTHAAVITVTGDRDDAARELDYALAAATAMPFPYGEASALMGLGRLHLAGDEPGQARDAWSRAIGIYERLGATLDARRLRHELDSL